MIDNLLTLVTSVLGGTSFVGYIMEKNKRKLEERQLGTDALKSMQESYDKFTEDFKERYMELSERYDKLLERYIILEEKYNKLVLEVSIIKKNSDSEN